MSSNEQQDLRYENLPPPCRRAARRRPAIGGAGRFELPQLALEF